MKKYELIEHTADVGIRVKARTLKALFSRAAEAMFDIIAEKKHSLDHPTTQETLIKQSADNPEELFINWLNELLSLSSAEEIIFSVFKIKKIGAKNLEAKVIGIDSKYYRINSEIKAATYHQLKIKKNTFGYQAEVIFDV